MEYIQKDYPNATSEITDDTMRKLNYDYFITNGYSCMYDQWRGIAYINIHT